VERFDETVQSGGAGETGIGIYKGSIYAEINHRIVRYSLPAGQVVPQSPPETIVSGLSLGGDHPMHPFIISEEGSLYVDVESATNSCQPQNGQTNIPGATGAPNWRLAAAYGVTTRGRRIRHFPRPTDSHRESTMAKGLQSTPRAGFSSLSTVEINCTRTGAGSTNPPRKPLKRPKS
jgi:hypothetical protein